MSNFPAIPPVRLFIGSYEPVSTKLVVTAGETFALLTGAPVIDWGKNHPALRWILPAEGAYRRDDLEPFFGEVYRSRTEHNPVFYIFPKVDLLNDSCANSMLKVLEEPPHATYFMLGAPCIDFVLPTIVSRSVLVTVGGSSDPLASVLIAHFMRKTPQSYSQFMKLIESEEIDERKTRILLDILTEQFQSAFREALVKNDLGGTKKTEQALRVLTYAYDRLPMPGSAKTFWRTIYLLMS